jgi:hypothetical protein
LEAVDSVEPAVVGGGQQTAFFSPAASASASLTATIHEGPAGAILQSVNSGWVQAYNGFKR